MPSKLSPIPEHVQRFSFLAGKEEDGKIEDCHILRGPDYSQVPEAELAAAILSVVEATASVSLALLDGFASSFSERSRLGDAG